MELFKESERDLFKPLPREEADRREYKGVELTDYAIINGATQAWFLDNTGITDNKKFLIIDKFHHYGCQNEFCIDYAYPDTLIALNAISIRPIKYVGEKKEKGIIYGEYPQELVYDKDLRKKLNEEFIKGTLQETGKIYSSGEIEYIYKGQKYIQVDISMDKEYYTNRFEGKRSNFKMRLDSTHTEFRRENRITDGIMISNKTVHSWIKVQPIVWINHPDDDYAITEKILFGARPYEEMLKFLRDDLPKDIQPSDISNIFGVLSLEEQIEKLKEMKEQLLAQAATLDRILAQTENKKNNDNLPGISEIALMENSIEQINNALQKRK